MPLRYKIVNGTILIKRAFKPKYFNFKKNSPHEHNRLMFLNYKSQQTWLGIQFSGRVWVRFPVALH